MYGYFMRCLLLTRKCPSQNCGKQQVGEELCVKRLAAVLCSEEEKGEEEEEVSAPAPASFLRTLSHS